MRTLHRPTDRPTDGSDWRPGPSNKDEVMQHMTIDELWSLIEERSRHERERITAIINGDV